MSKVTAWETSEIRGPKLALNLTPENTARMIKRAKRLLIIVGGEAIQMQKNNINVHNIASRISKSMNGSIASSPGVYKPFTKKPELNVINMGTLDIINRVKDDTWQGFDGKGPYDIVVFIGGIYYFQSMMLSTLKHFAPKLKTITIDPYYHPNATFSLENLKTEKWKEGIEAMLKILEAK
jgi:acetyl-CoA decarbonylase/synthase complex subunit epsilon